MKYMKISRQECHCWVKYNRRNFKTTKEIKRKQLKQNIRHTRCSTDDDSTRSSQVIKPASSFLFFFLAKNQQAADIGPTSTTFHTLQHLTSTIVQAQHLPHRQYQHSLSISYQRKVVGAYLCKTNITIRQMHVFMPEVTFTIIQISLSVIANKWRASANQNLYALTYLSIFTEHEVLFVNDQNLWLTDSKFHKSQAFSENANNLAQ